MTDADAARKRDLIRASSFLGRLPAPAIDRLADEAAVMGLRGGEMLFEQGEASDALYIVALGRLRVDLSEQHVVEAAAGDLVGEIGVLTGEPRTASARALRDTLLLQIDAGAFRRAMAEHDEAEREVLRLVVARLRGGHRERRLGRTRTVAVLPATQDADAGAFARRLSHALGRTLDAHVPLVDARAVDRDLGAGAAQTRFDAREANARLVEWLHGVEQDAAHVVFAADGMPEPWTLRCARQADRILLVADRGKPHRDSLQALETAASPAPCELVRCGSAKAFGKLRRQLSPAFVHLCPADNRAALDRLARQVAGRATGLVLGGGGARGFAHIGLLRALQEAGLAVDMIGGTSMGAFIAALHAQGQAPETIRDICHDVFVANNHLNDYVLPRVSLIRGRKFLRKLEKVFGDADIADLDIPYYCVSTNLTRGQPQVHRDGPLATWVATSMAVPGIAPPVVYRGELLADGAVVNSVPVDVMEHLDRGPVIACDVGAPGELALPGVKGPSPDALLKSRRKKRPTLSDILMRMTSMTSDLRLEENRHHADLFLRMPVGDIGMFDFSSLDEIIERGYEHACETLTGAAADWPGEEPAPAFSAPAPPENTADGEGGTQAA